MMSYGKGVFRRRVFGLARLALEPGTIVAPSHRSDHDVPVLMSVLYPHCAAAVARGVPWPTFAVRDDLFMPGFLSAYLPHVPATVRRLLWPISFAGPLEHHLQCVPVREPTEMLLVELVRSAPWLPLDGQLPDSLTTALRERAARLGRPEPRLAADVIDGGFADLLWTTLSRDELPGAEELWRERLGQAVRDFRRLIASLREGGVVVIFPEGDLSQDGEIGELRGGLRSLARRGCGRRVQPIAIAYDPLTRGRTRAYVSIAAPIETSAGGLQQAVSAALKAATPLTVGQIASHLLVTEGPGSPRALMAAAQSWLTRAYADRRPIDPELARPGRGRVLADAYRRAARRGAEDPDIRRLARELESAHRGAP
jgi:1-acyl-sn-glycerol-3-phosphate acyltransferase